jgi:hypothetical protein
MNKKTTLKLKKLTGYNSGLIEKARFRKLIDIYNKLPAKSRNIFVQKLESANIAQFLESHSKVTNSENSEKFLEKVLDGNTKSE